MTTPEQLRQKSLLPDDLKALLAELQVPTNDPILPLLAWIWKQMLDTKSNLDSARASTAAIFDNRLERMNKTAELLLSVDDSLQQIHKQLQAKPLRAKDVDMGRTQRALNFALFACGLMGGGLIGLCIGHLFASL